MSEIPQFIQLIAEAKHSASETGNIPPEIEDAIIDYSTVHQDEDFGAVFFPLLHQYVTELHVKNTGKEGISAQDVKTTFLITALLIEAGEKAKVYRSEGQANEVLNHYIQGLKSHKDSGYILDTATKLVGRKNPIWTVILDALSGS